MNCLKFGFWHLIIVLLSRSDSYTAIPNVPNVQFCGSNLTNFLLAFCGEDGIYTDNNKRSIGKFKKEAFHYKHLISSSD